MTRTKGVWHEARCQFMLFFDALDKKQNCRETAEGSFNLGDAAKNARDAGWRSVSGKWCCPGCLPMARAARIMSRKKEAEE